MRTLKKWTCKFPDQNLIRHQFFVGHCRNAFSPALAYQRNFISIKPGAPRNPKRIWLGPSPRGIRYLASLPVSFILINLVLYKRDNPYELHFPATQ
jgi:hypothetical protein